jgi:hypothetical protein
VQIIADWGGAGRVKNAAPRSKENPQLANSKNKKKTPNSRIFISLPFRWYPHHFDLARGSGKQGVNKTASNLGGWNPLSAFSWPVPCSGFTLLLFSNTVPYSV